MLPSIARRLPRAARTSRFVDSTGRQWEVREIPATAGERATCAASLLFETEGLIRRVRRYPANWSELPASELEALSWRT